MEYFAFGETFVEEHRSSNNSPYKFNGKELDEETGWYYYGARYYDPRISLWLSVDPLANMDYIMNNEAYINGEHNGGVFNSFNHNSYGYCYQNPITLLDPNGKQSTNSDVLTPTRNSPSNPKTYTPRGTPGPMEKSPSFKHNQAPKGNGLWRAIGWVAKGPGLVLGALLMPMTAHAPTYESSYIPAPAPSPVSQPKYDPKVKPGIDDKGNEQYYLYKTKREVKDALGIVIGELPYYGITKDKIIGGRYHSDRIEAKNAEIIAVGGYYEIKGAESAIINLNTDTGQSVREGTGIDNLIRSTTDPERIKAGKNLLNLQRPGWQTTEKQPKN